MVDKTIEQRLLSIIEEIYNIRVSVRENQGQGFLVNAEHNIFGFLSFIKTLPKDIKLPTFAAKSPVPAPAVAASITATPITLTTTTPKLVMDKA